MAGDEGHRQERGDYGKGRQNGGIAHLGDGKDCGQRFDLVELEVAVDIFHHHDGVVNQDADREDQRKEGHPSFLGLRTSDRLVIYS